MKFISVFFLLIVSAFAVFAQKTGEILATAADRSFTSEDLSPEAQKLRQNLPAALADARSTLFSQMVADALFAAEARAKNTTAEKIVEQARAEVPAPSETEIKTVYDANLAALGGKPLAEVRPQIVAFLRREPEQKALQAVIDSLKTKHKIAFGKDVNAPDLKVSDILATVGGRTITAGEFEEKYKFALYEAQAEVFDRLKHDLEDAVYAAVVAAEAKAQNIEASDLLAREVTDKMRDFSDEERFELQNALRKRLFAKHKVRFLLKEPAPVVQDISADDDPAQGTASAPVTIIMFSDFQCPACAAAHPVLKKIAAEYGARVRLVVRDFPLINIHENAFQAALAANAAFRQNKFFEYAEILYRNQNALDRDSLVKYAREAGLNPKQFEIDLSDEKIAAEIRKDMADGSVYGVKGTPTVFVNGVKIRHNSADEFREAIERELKK